MKATFLVLGLGAWPGVRAGGAGW